MGLVVDRSARSRRVATVSAAVVCATSAGLLGAAPAHAVDPDRLRSDAGCVWRTEEDRAKQIQTCTFDSESLGREVSVQVRPSDKKAGEDEHGIYFLDGLGSNPEFSTWTQPEAGIDAYGPGSNLVLPVGGAGEWSTDWQKPPTGQSVAPKWGSFVGEELPTYLKSNFDVETTNNAIVGVSMSAGPAMIIAFDNPEVFQVVRSYSGYFPTDNPLGWMAIPSIQKQRADIENGETAMWGKPQSPGNRWADNDVMNRIGEVGDTGQTVIVSTGTGIPTAFELQEAGALFQRELDADPTAGPELVQKAVTALALGIGLEAGAFASTGLLQSTVDQLGLPIEFKYRNGGHNWYAWGAESDDDAREVERALESGQPSSKTAAEPQSAPAPKSVGAPKTPVTKEAPAMKVERPAPNLLQPSTWRLPWAPR
ncbi:diacylglycerol O-acyltransferase / trehalose O-mycolyltransferase [Gordonia westfalica]|uniref:Diacylglycerol O-acyltransferase / trehalose O-mycolyltransferase n=1 Tax=Gordonia westfalica TaxID=158898 RepID=A0A1H2JQE7_9ACTN|nr:diacylglycerol O-acyltransferase / trehalose O-mycolyltransferase [Gordonia westfalica]